MKLKVKASHIKKTLQNFILGDTVKLCYILNKYKNLNII